MPLTPAQRILRSKIGAYARWGQCSNRTAATQPARDAFFQRFVDKVDPAITDPETRARAAVSLMREHYTRMALKSAQSRARKRNSNTDAAGGASRADAA